MKMPGRLLLSAMIATVSVQGTSLMADEPRTVQRVELDESREVFEGPRPKVTDPALSHELEESVRYSMTVLHHAGQRERKSGINRINGVEYQLYQVYPVATDPDTGLEVPMEAYELTFNHYADGTLDIVQRFIAAPETYFLAEDGTLEKFRLSDGTSVDDHDRTVLYRVSDGLFEEIPLSDEVGHRIEKRNAAPLLQRLDPRRVVARGEEELQRQGTTPVVARNEAGKPELIIVDYGSRETRLDVYGWEGDRPASMRLTLSLGDETQSETSWTRLD